MNRPRRLLAPSVVVAVVLAQFAPVLGGRVYRFEDIAGYFEPLWSAAARQMRAGHLPLWDRGAWSGQPLVGDPQAGIFYPLHLAWLALPVLRVYALMALLHALIGALGMYALCRARGRSPAASTVAGIALGVGAYVVMQVRHIMFVEATAWIPWLVLAGWRFVETRDRRWLGATAAATGLLLLTGGVSMIYFGAWFALAVLGTRALVEPRPRRAGAIAGLAIAALLGGALAVPMLAPMLAHARLSPRALGADDDFASQFAWKSWGMATSLFLPNPVGDAAVGTWWGGGTQWELAGYYAGMLPFALALYALLRGERSRRAERLALAAILLLALGLSREGSIVHRVAYRVLPLLSSTRCPARALYLFTLAVPMLAADGLDRIAERLRGRRRTAFVALAVAITAGDLLVAHRHWNPSLPLAEAEAAGRLDATAFLEAHRGDRYVNDVHLDHALHGSGLLWGLEDTSGYSSLPIWRYLHTLWIANHGAPYPHPKIHDDLSAQGLWRFSSPLIDALAVRWVLTARPPNGPGYRLAFHGADGVDVWENTEALPRAWLVGGARVVGDAAAAARAIAAPDFDPRREAVLEEPPSIAPSADGEAVVERIELPSPTEIAVTVRCAAPRLLVLAEPAHPDWRASLDGAEVKWVVADYALRAVAVPAGRHVVTMRLGAGATRPGLAIGALALALVGALAFRRRR